MFYKRMSTSVTTLNISLTLTTHRLYSCLDAQNAGFSAEYVVDKCIYSTLTITLPT